MSKKIFKKVFSIKIDEINGGYFEMKKVNEPDAQQLRVSDFIARRCPRPRPTPKPRPKTKLRTVRAKSKSKISMADARRACSCPKSQDQIELITAGFTPKEKKVYCGDCKYLRDNYSYFGFALRPIKYFCYAPYNLVKRGDFKNNWKQPVADPQELNSNNNCKHYRRKWYKFWK